MTELNIGRRARPSVPRARMTTGRFARLFFTDNIARFYLVTSVALTIASIAWFGITPGMLAAALSYRANNTCSVATAASVTSVPTHLARSPLKKIAIYPTSMRTRAR